MRAFGYWFHQEQRFSVTEMERQTRFWFRYPLATSATAIAISLAVGWFLLLPQAYHLAKATRRALFPWVIWYKPYFLWAEESQVWLTWLPVPFLVLTTFLLVRKGLGAVLPAWRARLDVIGGKSRAFAVGAGFALILIPSGAVFAALFLLNAACRGPSFGTDAFQGAVAANASCQKCHSLELPLNLVRDPEYWGVAVARMRTAHGVSVSDRRAEKIEAYLRIVGSYGDRWLYWAKCARCHVSEALFPAPRPAEEWDRIIDRASRLSPFAFRADWMAQVKRHVRANVAADTDPETRTWKESKALFEKSCGACHRLGLIVEPRTYEATSADLIRIMGEKAPDRWSPAEAERLEAFVRELPREAEEFDHLFPHDRAVEVAW